MIKFNGEWVGENERVLDAGGGVNPWERANVVADLYTGVWANRKIEVKDGFLIDEGKKFEFVQTALEKMPFEDKSFDWIFCSHALEHVDDPAKVCEELMRVGKRGIIRTPEIGRESLWGDPHHRWFVHLMDPNTLIIFPKQDKDKQEIRLKGELKNLFWTLLTSNDLVKKCVSESPDLATYWYVNLVWNNSFNYIVLYENGKIKTNLNIKSNFKKIIHHSETANCRDRLAKYCHGVGLDIGFGGDPIIPNAITLDLPTPYTNMGDAPQHLTGTAKDLSIFSNNSLSWIFSSHLLEDFDEKELIEILTEWFRVLKPNGFIITFGPNEKVFSEHCRKTGQPYNHAHKIPEYGLEYLKKLLETHFSGQFKIIYEISLINVYSFDLVIQKS